MTARSTRRARVRRAASAPVLLAAFALAAAAALAQAPRGPQYARVAAAAQPAALKPGAAGKLVIRVVVAPGFHINSAHPKDPSLIATAFAPKSAPGVTYGMAVYPRSVPVMSAGAMIPAYTGSVAVVVPFKVAASARPGHILVGGTLTYQGCNATACYPPKQDAVTSAVTVR